jgi:hypothetical protein
MTVRERIEERFERQVPDLTASGEFRALESGTVAPDDYDRSPAGGALPCTSRVPPSPTAPGRGGDVSPGSGRPPGDPRLPP